MQQQFTSTAEIEIDLRTALDNGELEVYYQPLIDLTIGACTGFEALVRWNHPRLGLVSPMDFLAVAEQSDLIIEIGNWVLRTACRQTREWQTGAGHSSNLTIGVNLSAKQLREADLAATVEMILSETGLDPNCLILEVSERNMMMDTEFATDVLKRVHAIGVRLAMDDFGLGYSSLGALNRFPLDFLKLDRPFVRSMEKHADILRVASTIVSLTKKLGIATIAEGVESPEQAAILSRLNCRYAQGYYFSRPLTADAVQEWLTDADFRPSALAPPVSSFYAEAPRSEVY